MARNENKQVVHRPGPFKQSNKAHKSGKSKSKKNDKGKVDVKTASRNKKRQLNRTERRNQLNQLRKAKKEEVLKTKRQLGSVRGSPVLVTILPINDTIDTAQFLEHLKSFDDELIVTQSPLGHCHITYPQFKQRYTFLIPNKKDLHSVLDSLKVSEVLLLLHSPEDLDDYTEMLLSTIMGHALPTTIHTVQGLDKLNPKKKAECRKIMLKSIETRFPDANIHQADTRDELKLLMLQIGTQKQRVVAFRDNRFHMLAENVAFNLPNPDSGVGTLMVSGYVRGQPLNINGLVHLPGWGTYQMSRVDQKCDPHASEKFNKAKILETTEEADPQEQESLQSEVIPDPMEGEQTWPTQEELDAAERRPKRTVKKVAEGTSDYQACWIVESEEEGSDESEDESQGEQDESQMMSEDESEGSDENMDDTESIASVNNENYDDKLDLDEEKQTLVRFKEERMNQMFPDEQDTPIDVSARIRYQKYRGLKSCTRSPWDPMENLPLDYARIYRFENFRQTKKKVMKTEREGVEPGQYVTVYIKDVPQSLYDSVITEKSTFVVYGLLPHEQKMSMVNTVIRKHPSCKIPIKAKDTLIFHSGFSRFTVKPIFSEHSTGNKFKYERYLPSDSAVVSSFYAPVMFPPAPVVVFRQRPDGSHQLVATGSALDVNPNRIVVKRIVLSGHAFKVHKRSAVIRYMFFNKEDIYWFKCVEVRTKCGRKGHIREALGTHGHMKCVFDQQIQSHDVVLMSLYKRVYPKWNYNLHVPTPVNGSELRKNDMECMM